MDDALAKANGLLIVAVVKALGVELGLVDADVALHLLDKSKIKVSDDGTVAGVKEALEALNQGKSYLFGAAGKSAAMAQRLGGSVSTLSGVEERFYAKNPHLKL